MQKVYINGRFLESELTGVGRYSINVIKEIDLLLDDDRYANLDIELVIPNIVRAELELKNINIRHIGFNQGSLWEQLDLPICTYGKFLISLHSHAPIFKTNQIVVLHDGRMTNAKKTDAYFAQRMFILFMGIILGKRLKRIITISNYAKKELHENYGIANHKMVVIPEGCNHVLNVQADVAILQKFSLSSVKYVLAVGGGSAKNNVYTARALAKYAKNDLHFVLVSGTPEHVKQELIKAYDKVHILGRVTDEELVALYKNAFCLAFPSISEGFGIPPIEAMALGCPVIVSNVDSLPEICGEAALYCDPYNIDSFIASLGKLYDDSFRKKFITIGRKYVKKYHWKSTAEHILEEICNFGSD